MNSPQAILNKILPYSIVDGPGNRLVLFFQGCNFSCAACHNPYTVGVCDHCGDCLAACEQNALSMMDGRVVFDAQKCTQCDDCLEACPISASPMVTKYTVGQILEIIRKHLPFLTGITVSGGESTLQIKFVHALFEAIKADTSLARLTCFIDSNGHLGAKSWQEILPITDGVMLDIKAFSTELHRELTGQNNQHSLASAALLESAGKLYEVRFLLVPGVNDTLGELEQMVKFVGNLNPKMRIRLNAFQHHGVKGKALEWNNMDENRLKEISAFLAKRGITNVIMPQIYQ